MPKPNGRNRYNNAPQNDRRKHFGNIFFLQYKNILFETKYLFTEHDDRTDRKVRFNNYFKPGKFDKKNINWGESLRHHLEDEDIDMMASSSARARNLSRVGYGRKGGRTGSPAPKDSGSKKRKLFEGPTNWYRVLVCVLYKLTNILLTGFFYSYLTETNMTKIMF